MFQFVHYMWMFCAPNNHILHVTATTTTDTQHSFIFERSPSYEVFMLSHLLVHERREHSLLCTVMFMWCMQAEIFSVSSALFSDIVHGTRTSHNHHDFTGFHSNTSSAVLTLNTCGQPVSTLTMYQNLYS
jgi:hypothetical protein